MVEATTIQMTDEQLRVLIETVRSAAQSESDDDSTLHLAVPSFRSCTHKFGGSYNKDTVEKFITNVVTFKELEGISDKRALKDLSLLFTGIASTWWPLVCGEAKTWSDAISLIREHFSPSKPSYQIYLEFFESSQGDEVTIDTFVAQKRAVLAQFPERWHSEGMELDFLYGLLNIKYRKHIPRTGVKTFKDLLEQARVIEQKYQEIAARAKAKIPVPPPMPSPRQPQRPPPILRQGQSPRSPPSPPLGQRVSIKSRCNSHKN